jgi:transcriptional regulator with XRE-family HTH domain
MNNIHLGEMINYYRKQNGWTMKQLGEKMNKTESAISLWISGKRSPMVDDLDKLSKLFDVSPETLMFGNNASPIIEETLNTMKKLEEPRQQIVLNVAREQHEEQEAERKAKEAIPLYKDEETLYSYIDEAAAWQAEDLSEEDRETIMITLRDHLEKKAKENKS